MTLQFIFLQDFFDEIVNENKYNLRTQKTLIVRSVITRAL